MASKVKKAEAKYETKTKLTFEAIGCKEKYDNACKRPRGRRPDFERRIDLAEQQAQKAKEELNQLKKDQETLRDAKAQIGQVYHPYNLKSGKRQTSQDVSQLLEELFDKIKTATQGLSEKCRNKVSKAQRVVKEMVGTIAFFHTIVAVYLDNMNLSDRDQQLMENHLIPGYYLKQAAAKQRDITVKKTS